MTSEGEVFLWHLFWAMTPGCTESFPMTTGDRSEVATCYPSGNLQPSWHRCPCFKGMFWGNVMTCLQETMVVSKYMPSLSLFSHYFPLELNAKPRRHHHHRNTGMRQDASHPNTHLAGSIAPTPLPAHATCRLRRDDIFPCQPGTQWTCQKLEYLKMEDPPNCFPHRQVQ